MCASGSGVPGWHTARKSPATRPRLGWPATAPAGAPEAGQRAAGGIAWTAAGAPHLRSLLLSKARPAPACLKYMPGVSDGALLLLRPPTHCPFSGSPRRRT